MDVEASEQLTCRVLDRGSLDAKFARDLTFVSSDEKAGTNRSLGG